LLGSLKALFGYRRRAKLQSQEEQDEAVNRRLRSKGARIGERCRIYARDFPVEAYLVTIGNHVGIAGGVKILTHNGAARLLKERRPEIQNLGRVEIGDACFIGENAILLPGTTIGAGCIVVAGAVVSGTIPENSLVAGNPARVMGRASLYLERLALSPDSLDTFGLPEDDRRRVILEHSFDYSAARPHGDGAGNG
jgi:acetyltransferase-like isoleucine patch superfamily enzyme